MTLSERYWHSPSTIDVQGSRTATDFYLDTLPTGSFPLHVACGSGLLLTAAKLLRNGADANEADDPGWTSLIAAASYNRSAIVTLLVDHMYMTKEGKDGSSDVDQCDAEGWNPLIWAIVNGNHEMVEFLLAAGADSTIEGRSNWRPNRLGYF